jgi:ribosomal subunit interface protein
MQLTVQGKQMDLGDALKGHVSQKINDINEKYFNHATGVTVTFSPEGHGHGLIKTQITMSVGKDLTVVADAKEADSYISFDTAADKVAKQLRRYKKRIRDHHRRQEVEQAEFIKARNAVLPADTAEDIDDSDEHVEREPVVIAEMSTNIQKMSVSEAVMRMDLSGESAFMFRNASNDAINMVYRRADGNIGWVDTESNS